jgi:predicted  nucleic acid-binding Zn-ribbon protein
MISDLNAKLNEGRATIEGLKESLDENQKERKRLQDQINVEKERIERVEGKLPQIKTNKEYQALVKEMDSMRKEISRCEEAILNLMEEEETTSKELQEKSESFSTEEQEISKKISDYEFEMSKFDDKISKFEREKKSHTGSVDNAHLQAYERIKSRRDGIAIVAAIDGVCQGCYMNIPPQLFIMIQRSAEIITCPNCNRILYWRED